MSAFYISRDGLVLRVRFGDPAAGDTVVRDAQTAILDLERRGELSGGGLLCIDGRCSVAVAVLLGHALAHLFAALAVFDPKLNGYIISVSHHPDWAIGQVVDPDELRMQGASGRPNS